jgi:pyruvate dehydrogenase E1 component alpha subunit
MDKLEKEEFLLAYQSMLLIRRLEEELVKHYYSNRIMSFVHFSVGMEGTAVSVAQNLPNNSKIFGNHRSHAHYLACGGDPGKMVAEMLGKKAGCSGGAGGSMHLVDTEIGFMGSTPILGPVVSIGAGAALAKKINKEKGIVISFLGDGASEAGVFYETCNFAALHKLPFLMVIENNLFSVNSPLSARRSTNRSTREIIEGFGLKYIYADGNDFEEANIKAKESIKATQNGIPTVLEMEVFRHMAHSAPIFDEKCRVTDTKEEREKKDSVKGLKSLLEQAGENLGELERNIEKEVAAAMEFGINAI